MLQGEAASEPGTGSLDRCNDAMRSPAGASPATAGHIGSHRRLVPTESRTRNSLYRWGVVAFQITSEMSLAGDIAFFREFGFPVKGLSGPSTSATIPWLERCKAPPDFTIGICLHRGIV